VDGVDAAHMRLIVRRAVVFAACLVLLSAIALPAATAQGPPGGVLMPALSGNRRATYAEGGVTIDYGNASQGYVMIKHSPVDVPLKVCITRGETAYTYDLNSQGAFEVYPLQMGNGSYRIEVFSWLEGNAYLPVAEKAISVMLDDPHISYLYPSQYVNYTPESMAVAKSNELCEGLETQREKAMAIYAFIGRRIHYDYLFSVRPKSGYLPDVDSVLDRRRGICFDYAALMACMLRAQGIPTKLVIGYADRSYHAWNNVLLDGKWHRLDAAYVSVSMRAEVYREERYY